MKRYHNDARRSSGQWRRVAAQEYYQRRLRNDSRVVLWKWKRLLEKTGLVWKAR